MQSLLQLEDQEKRAAAREEASSSRKELWREMRRFPFFDPELHRGTAGWAAFLVLLITSAVFGIMVALVLVFSINLPQMEQLERYRPNTTTELYDVHGQVVGSFALEHRVVVAYTEFPKSLRDGILSIEDKNFETNGGVNLVRVVGAAYQDLHSDRRSQGASTITMQLARNLFLSSEKTYGRKLQEIFLTLQIERHFTKQQIFTLYANQIYLGRGTYGFEAGAEYYFSKRARDLTLPEAALLAALPKGPESYSPVRFPERALKRRNLVLSELVQDGKITEAQAAEAKLAPLGLNLQVPKNTEAPYFVEEVRRQLEREYGVDEVHGAGLRVYTTLDLDLQRTANKAVLDGVAIYEHRRGWVGNQPNILSSTPGSTSGVDQNLDEFKHPDWIQPIREGSYFHALVTAVTPTRVTVRIGMQQADLQYPEWAWTGMTKATQLARLGDLLYVKVTSQAAESLKLVLEQDSGAQGSMMAMNNADGEVLAMVGGRDYALSQFNRATQSQRQVGSSFKPYVYTAAMEAGMKPYDTVSDAPATFFTASGPYSPHDYEKGYRGQMTLIDAFAESRNLPALRLADKVGIKTVIATARRFGVTSNMPNFLPVAIGAADITLAEQVGAYTVFPNDGIRIAPHYIRKVVQADGTPVQQKPPEVREVISLDIARKMMTLLQAVVTHGTAASASSLKHAFGGKTGTTNNYTDAWFIGFSPSITCGTWMGFDTRQSLGEKETGARAALPMWMDFMKVAVADRPNEQFSRANAPKRQLAVAASPRPEENEGKTAEDMDKDEDQERQPPPANPLPPLVQNAPSDEPALPAPPPAQAVHPLSLGAASGSGTAASRPQGSGRPVAPPPQ